MKNQNLRKIVMTAVFAAIAVACSAITIPVGGSKCAPMQHLVNILSGVFLGPGYAAAQAFTASLIRNLLGTGTLLAFPGSMIGAFLSGLAYQKLKKVPLACIGEVIGTGVLGGIAAYFVASLVMGREAAFFTYVPAFLLSSFGGALLAFLLVPALQKAGFTRFFGQTDRIKEHPEYAKRSAE
ncbi:MAG: energy coupling factor transporter S component ThiW [Oscillospiraceae bacterium]|nr:energy coupling factor transporter S component ThiW [Oscillospiraceae bacterium]